MLRVGLVLILALLLAGMVSRAIRPTVARREPGPRIETAAKCPSCGAYRVGTAACERPDCPARSRG
ncbi:MAG: hypothetical protein U1E34_06615 [Amaricoccus sp.]